MPGIDDYLTAREAAKRLGVSYSRMRQLLNQGRIRGARKHAGVWAIPQPVERIPGERGPKPMEWKNQELQFTEDEREAMIQKLTELNLSSYPHTQINSEINTALEEAVRQVTGEKIVAERDLNKRTEQHLLMEAGKELLDHPRE